MATPRDETAVAKREYGTGGLYKRASDNRWVGTIEAGWTKNGSRRRVTVTAKTQAEAKRRLRDRGRQIEAEGTQASVRTTVKAWAESWLTITERTSRPKTFTTDRGAVKAWIIPTIGHKRLDALTPGDVRAVSTALRAAGHSTSTALRYHGVLLRMLKAAVQDGHNVPPRVLAVRPPEKAVTDRTALTSPEALRMLEVASHLQHGSRWAVALLEGIRQGEALGLTWAEVDLDRELMTVSWQLQSLPYLDKSDHSRGFRVPDGYDARQIAGAAHLVRPKSRAGWRVIPLVPWAGDALARWREVCPPSPDGLVWPTSAGGPANIRHDTTEWEALQCTAEVGHPAGRYYYGHEARNTAATLLMELGVPESVRLAIMGHSSIATTRGYEHVDTAQSRAALERVAERLGLGRPAHAVEFDEPCADVNVEG